MLSCTSWFLTYTARLYLQHFIDQTFLLLVQWLSLVQAYAFLRLHNAYAYFFISPSSNIFWDNNLSILVATECEKIIHSKSSENCFNVGFPRQC
jgi:hypothetical protein